MGALSINKLFRLFVYYISVRKICPTRDALLIGVFRVEKQTAELGVDGCYFGGNGMKVYETP